MICKNCFKEFFDKKHKNRKFCSKKCFSIFIDKKIDKICPVCNIKFRTSPSHNTACCSFKCKGIAQKNSKTDIWKYIHKKSHNECWEWKGSLSSAGYGMIMINYTSYLAHRLAYELAFGLIPDGLWVLHKCDNPPCCNPDHLFLGNHSDNMLDMYSKNRGVDNKGEKCGTSKLTESEIVKIRKLCATGKYTNQKLADMFHVSTTAIHMIRYRKTWKHI